MHEASRGVDRVSALAGAFPSPTIRRANAPALADFSSAAAPRRVRILHGTRDVVAPFPSAVAFADALTARGVDVDLGALDAGPAQHLGYAFRAMIDDAAPILDEIDALARRP